MKKVLIAVIAGLFVVPAYALNQTDSRPGDLRGAQMQEHKNFRKQHKEHLKKMKANQEKMTKLVSEYTKLPDGKKKEAKRQEIVGIVGDVRSKQLEFKEKQLKRFSERLLDMEQNLRQEKEPRAQEEWVNHKTDELITHDGRLEVLFRPERDEMAGPGIPGPMMGKHGPHGRPGLQGPFPPLDDGQDKPLPPPQTTDPHHGPHAGPLPPPAGPQHTK